MLLYGGLCPVMGGVVGKKKVASLLSLVLMKECEFFLSDSIRFELLFLLLHIRRL